MLWQFLVVSDPYTQQKIDGNELEWLVVGSKNEFLFNVWRKINEIKEVESLPSVIE